MNNNVIANAKQNAVAKSDSKKTMTALVKSMEGEIAKALPSVITPERFTRMVLSAMSVNPQLAECTSQSFLGAMMNAAQLGLEPNTPLGQAYIIPYKDHGVLKAQFQIGYKGLIDLAYRSGAVSIVDAQVVYENDDFEYELGLNPVLKHKPALSNRGKAIMYYAVFRTTEGGYGFQVMSIEDVTKHMKAFSKAANSGFSPWTTNFDEMAKKTVLKKALKYAPLKSDFAKAVTQDETIKSSIDKDMYEVGNEMSYTDAEYTEVTDEPAVDPSTGEISDEEISRMFEETRA